jgi:hypothetical protein
MGTAALIAAFVAASISGGTIPSGAVKKQDEVFQHLWGTEFEWRFDELPRKGSVPSECVPYSGYIYPDTGGGTRYALRLYDRAFHGGRLLAAGHEQWDTTAFKEPVRRGLLGLLGGTRMETPDWHGHCNGWTAATIRHAEPQQSVVRNGVKFDPSDIKALLAELYIYNDLEHLAGVDYRMNAGLFHAIVGNWLGRGQHGLGMEADPGKEKWNYPVYAYASSAARRGERRVEVKTNLAYLKDTNSEYEESPRLARFKYFHYYLQLDGDGKIVGGSFLRDSSAIEMLWVPLRPKPSGHPGHESGNPYIDINKILAIWRDSVPEEVRRQWVVADPYPDDRVVGVTREDALVPLQGFAAPQATTPVAVDTGSPNEEQAPPSVQPDIEPEEVVFEPEPEPVMEDVEPVSEDVEPPPVMEGIETAPVMDDAETTPVTEDVESGPVTEDMETCVDDPAPVNSVPILGADHDFVDSEPTESSLPPVVEEPARSPAAADAELAVEPTREPERRPAEFVIEQPERLRENPAPQANRRETESLRDPAETVEIVSASELLELRTRLRSCLRDRFVPRLDVQHESPRSILHSAVAYGVDAEVRAQGRDVNALGWLCWNRACDSQQILAVKDGQITPRTGTGLQEFPGQFLAVLALARVPAQYVMKANEQDFTVEDLVAYEQSQCGLDDALALRLIGLSHYLDSDATWENDRGDSWSLSKLVDQLLSRPVVRLSRDASLRMLALSNAVRHRERQQRPLKGPWAKAKEHLETRQAIALDRLVYDVSSPRRAEATGASDQATPEDVINTLEWLAHSLSGAQLRDVRVVRSVDYLIRILGKSSTTELDAETRAHGLHTLSVYGERVFAIRPGRRPFLYASIDTR